MAEPTPTGPPRIAFVTHAGLPDGSPDDRLAFEEIRRRGMEPVAATWDDPAVDWGSFALAIVRSTWDYHRRRAAFLAWVDRAARATTVLNAPELLRWNSHKSYLLELARMGHEVVPTELVPESTEETLGELLHRRGWARAVAKPAVSASSEGLFHVTARPAPEEEARFATLVRTGDVLVQPELEAVRELGERSLVFVDGAFSHSAEYPYLLGEGIRSERYPRPRTPTEEELLRCRLILAELPVRPLYARLDFLPESRERWVLGELELIEPELLFRTAPGAEARFCEALALRLGR